MWAGTDKAKTGLCSKITLDSQLGGHLGLRSGAGGLEWSGAKENMERREVEALLRGGLGSRLHG